MVNVLSFPIELAPNGQFAKFADDSDSYKAQQISAFVRTSPGERKAFRNFGTDDPTFDDFDSAGWIERFVQFYPKGTVTLDEIQVVRHGNVISAINVSFE